MTLPALSFQDYQRRILKRIQQIESTKTMTSRRPLVLVIVLSAAVLVSLLSIVVVQWTIQADSEATRRAGCMKQLKQIEMPLGEYEMQNPKPVVADAAKLPFDTYSGYFVSNQFEPDVSSSARRSQWIARASGGVSHSFVGLPVSFLCKKKSVNAGRSIGSVFVVP